MNNIFDNIVNNLPKTPAPIQAKLEEAAEEKVSKNKLNEVVQRWQKSPTDEDTSFLLNKMQPTIKAAIKSYAPQMGNSMKIQAAKLTLNALKSYDPTRGADPTTHVFNNLKRLNRIAGQRSNIVHVSEARSAAQLAISKAMAEFEEDNDREPSMEELADITGFSLKKLDKLIGTNKIVSESATLSEDSKQSTFTSNNITDDDYFEYVYASVGPIDKSIMEWSAGKHGKPQLANQEIATKLKITPAAVSMRKNKIQQLMSDVRGNI
jgi:DNA-directed RNA polymerase specialized sigma subunit